MPLSSLISGVGYMSTTLKSPSDVSDTLILFILDALTQWSFNLYGTARTYPKSKSLFWEEIHKSMCSSSCMLCYGGMWLSAIPISFASYGGDVICACCAKKAECQWTQTMSNLIP